MRREDFLTIYFARKVAQWAQLGQTTWIGPVLNGPLSIREYTQMILRGTIV